MYKEVGREDIPKLEACVEEMAGSDTIVRPVKVQTIRRM